ncbi:MAG: SBBP repeat-containing protein [Verrucomicrobiota bacterium]
MKIPSRFLFFGSFLSIFVASHFLQNANADSNPAIRRHEFARAFGELPLSFEANQGTAADKQFQARGQGYLLSLAPNEAVLTLRTAAEQNGWKNENAGEPFPNIPKLTCATVRMKLIGANSCATAEPLNKLEGKINYFLGNDPAKWRTNISTYAKVKFQEVYPGVDWICYGNQRQFEYDFVVAPGADPNAIVLRVEGASQLEVAASGELVIETQAGEIRQHKPIIYQQVDGAKRRVPGGYQQIDRQTVCFQVGQYDATKPLVIDPILVYSILVGADNEVDVGMSIAVDSAGNAYIFGQAARTNDVPTTDIFITKLKPDGTGIVYGTYLGGGDVELAGGIAVDEGGNAYVTGTTKSADFPTSLPMQSKLRGPTDAFVCKLNPAGNGFVFSTYLGGDASVIPAGTGAELGTGIAVDLSENIYVTGTTSSQNFGSRATKAGFPPSSTRFQPALNGQSDAYVAKLTPDGSAFEAWTYLGGSGPDLSLAISVDSQANIVVIGSTPSDDFPTQNPAQAGYGGGRSDMFVAKLNESCTALVFGSYLGGSNEEATATTTGLSIGAGVAIDFDDNIYVAADTTSADFPVKGALQPTLRGASDGFVTKFNPQGAFIYSTFLGGSGDDGCLGVAVDRLSNVYVTGGTLSTDFPTVNPLQAAPAGQIDGFVTMLDPTGSALVFSTYFGADGASFGNAIATDTFGSVYVTGFTSSTNFPNTNTKTGKLRTSFTVKIFVFAPTPDAPTKLIQSYGFTPQREFALQIAGARFHNYRLEFSTDLINWVFLSDLNNPSGKFQFTDNRAALFPRGFYRVK